MATFLENSDTDALIGLTPEELNLTDGGIIWPAIAGGAAAVLCLLELYKWGYDYANDRLHNK